MEQTKKQPFYLKWWFWALLGVLLIASAGVLLLMNNKEVTGGETYIVKFDKQNGEEIVEVEVKEGETVAELEAPTKQPEGSYTYHFLFWTTNNSPDLPSTAFDFLEPITKDITLYALYQDEIEIVNQIFTPENFETVTVGMPKIAVESLLGTPTNITTEGDNEIYLYEMSTIDNFEIVFQNDLVVSKNKL